MSILRGTVGAASKLGGRLIGKGGSSGVRQARIVRENTNMRFGSFRMPAPGRIAKAALPVGLLASAPFGLDMARGLAATGGSLGGFGNKLTAGMTISGASTRTHSPFAHTRIMGSAPNAAQAMRSGSSLGKIAQKNAILNYPRAYRSNGMGGIRQIPTTGITGNKMQ